MSGTTTAMGNAWTQHLRLALMRAMLDCPARRAHESLLVDLVAGVGIAADRDQVREALLWLHDQELVVGEVAHGSIVATLTERGEWVAEGKRDHEGVKRPNATAGIARRALSISIDQLKR
ncbi:MAG: ArsR family transcriptional regulator [Rhodospirillaceae bacterium]|nr:MAG: ArsR family transcriptional regulator [Rhodospirillaceae bacterium]